MMLKDARDDVLVPKMAGLSRKYPAMLKRFYESVARAGRHTPMGNVYNNTYDVIVESPADPREIQVPHAVVWYAKDDEDCPPSHGKWLAERLDAKTRVFDGFGHVGGCLIDHEQFLHELMASQPA